MNPEQIRSTMKPLQEEISRVAQGWTMAICSPNNELITFASLYNTSCKIATNSIAELIAALPADSKRVLIICDDELPDGGALELMRQLHQCLPDVTVRVLAYLPQSTAPARLAQLHDGGVDALCSKCSTGTGNAARALIQVLHGQQIVDAHFREPLRKARLLCSADPSNPGFHPPLSSNELELIQLLGRGHNATQIAALQQKRGDTIRRQLSLLYRKTGVSDQRGLIAWSLARGLIRPLDLVAAAAPAASEPGFPAADGNRRRNPATHH